jgi:hypothetical protein
MDSFNPTYGFDTQIPNRLAIVQKQQDMEFHDLRISIAKLTSRVEVLEHKTGHLLNIDVLLHKVKDQVENVSICSLFCVQSLVMSATMSWSNCRSFVLKYARFLPYYFIDWSDILNTKHKNIDDCLQVLFKNRRNPNDSSDTYDKLVQQKTTQKPDSEITRVGKKRCLETLEHKNSKREQ